MGDVDFGGVTRRVCLAYVPEASAGDYAIVHAGFAICMLDQQVAARTLELMRHRDRNIACTEGGASEDGHEVR